MPFLSIKAPLLQAKEGVFLDSSRKSHFRLVNTKGTFELLLKRRTAYPTTICKQTGQNTFQLGYGNIDGDTETEFLDIRLDADSTLYIRRDAFCTLPIFYAHTHQGLSISNDYADVVGSLDLATVSKDAIHYFITQDRYEGRTYIEEVKQLGEREVLVWQRGQLHVMPPPPRNWIESSAAPPQDPKLFRSVLIEHFEHFYNTRLRNQNFAYEVSGGLDSATLPQLLAQRGIRGIPVATRLYGTTFRKPQLHKLQDIITRVRGELIAEPIDASSDFPFSSLLSGPTYPFFARNPFAEVDERYAQKLRNHDINILVTGHGGDDIFEKMSIKANLTLKTLPKQNKRRYNFSC